MSAANGLEELAAAVWAGNLSGVEAFIATGGDVNAIAEGRFSPPLYYAIEQMHVEIARRLIAAGADINYDLGQGQTAVFHAIDIESDCASQRGLPPNETSTELTELLLAAGAIPTEEAFQLARAYDNRQALSLLEQAEYS